MAFILNGGHDEQFAQFFQTTPLEEVSRHDVLASLMEMFPSESRGLHLSEETPARALEMAPQAISRVKASPCCNIESEQLWRILDKQFGFGVTFVIMGYWANENPPAQDLFHEDDDPPNRFTLEGVEVYQQAPEEFNHAFYEKFNIADCPGPSPHQWFGAEHKAAAGMNRSRHDTLSCIKEIFAGREEYACQEERKDEEMPDAHGWNDGWNDGWHTEEARSSGFDNLFRDDDSAFALQDDDWKPYQQLTTAAVDLEARAVEF